MNELAPLGLLLCSTRHPVDQVRRHEANLVREVLGAAVPSAILPHILGDKFRRGADAAVASEALSKPVVQTLVGHIVHQQFEQVVVVSQQWYCM